MRKEGRRRSKAGLKVDFSGGEAKKSRATGCWTETSFCCRWRCPICRDVTATEGESRTIGRICQAECQQEDIGTGDFNSSSPWSDLIWYLIIFDQWAEKRSERLAKPAKVTRGKSNLSSWKVPSKIFGSSPTILTMLSQVFLRARQAWSAGGDDKSSWGLFNEGNRQRPGGW